MWFVILHLPVSSTNVLLHFLFFSASQGQKKRGPKISVIFLDIYLKTTLKVSGRYILKKTLYSLPDLQLFGVQKEVVFFQEATTKLLSLLDFTVHSCRCWVA